MSRAWRSELDPGRLPAARRASSTGPRSGSCTRTGAASRGREIAERSWRLANALRGLGLGAARPRGRAVAQRAADPRGPLRRARRRACSSSRSTPAWPAPRSATSSAHAARGCCSWTTSCCRSSSRWRWTASPSCAATTAGGPTARTRRCWPPPRPTSPCAALADEEEPISINYTSGTTGRPKGVQYTYRGAYLNALSECIVAGLQPESTYLWTLPMFHCNGWCFPWAVTAVGATHVTMRKVDPGRGLAADRRGGRDALQRRADGAAVGRQPPAGPSRRAARDRAGGRRAAVADALRPHGGAQPPRRPRLRPDRDVRPDHRLAVAAGRGTRSQPAEQARLRARQGQAYPTGDLVRVVDEHDARRPARRRARWARSSCAATTSCAATSTTTRPRRPAFRGGWFHSGDLAVWHPDGNVELRDRAKDIIISGGENISTIEVEQAVVSHPAVLECAVVAMPHEHWGERPKAFVTLKDGRAGDRGRAGGALSASAWRATSARTPSSSGRCRRRRPARCRSSCCATASGPATAPAASAAADARLRARPPLRHLPDARRRPARPGRRAWCAAPTSSGSTSSACRTTRTSRASWRPGRCSRRWRPRRRTSASSPTWPTCRCGRPPCWPVPPRRSTC